MLPSCSLLSSLGLCLQALQAGALLSCAPLLQVDVPSLSKNDTCTSWAFVQSEGPSFVLATVPPASGFERADASRAYPPTRLVTLAGQHKLKYPRPTAGPCSLDPRGLPVVGGCPSAGSTDLTVSMAACLDAALASTWQHLRSGDLR
jgi:hypothetical protein